MVDVIGLSGGKRFELSEANGLVSVIRKFTRDTQKKVDVLSTQASFVPTQEKKQEIEQALQRVFDSWCCKVTKLGAIPKGMWLVDFDNGEGYFCWAFPEEEVEHYHGYDEGFKGRVKLM